MKEKIAIIGNGNMGQAIAQRLCDKKIVTQEQLFLTNAKTANNQEAAQKADVVILAIKPQVAQVVLAEIKDVIAGKLIISIMAGIGIDTIQQALGEKTAIVRAMPNLAAKIGKSMTVWVKNKDVTGTQAEIAKTILEAIGSQLELHTEDQINAATAISGSGPAYFFYLVQLIAETAQKLGFSSDEAAMLVKQTFLGSAELLDGSSMSAEELRIAVTSKGGTTQAAIETFQKAGLADVITEGILASKKRAEELSKIT